MSLAYIPPGVSVEQITNTNFQPITDESTTICIVGPASGSETLSQLVQLVDDVPVALGVPNGINLSSVVVTSLDGTTTYVQGSANGNTGIYAGRPSGDYYISGNQIIRSMQTAIPDGATVFVYYEVDSGAGVTPQQELHTLTSSGTAAQVALNNLGAAGTTLIQNISIQAQGIIPQANYTVSYGATRSVTDGVLNATTTVTSATASFTSRDVGATISGGTIPANAYIVSVTNSTTVVISAAATGSATSVHLSITQASTIVSTGLTTLFSPSTKQTVYLDFIDQYGTQHYNVAVTLNGATAVNIPGNGLTGPNPANSGANANLKVKNVAVVGITTTAVKYLNTATSTALLANDNSCDYACVGNASTPQTYYIYRDPGTRPTTTTSSTEALSDGDTVSVTFDATPLDYYLPTQCFSQADVTNKYGPALDANGNVLTPVSLASALAFQAGAPSVIIQALFSLNVVNGVSTYSPGGVQTTDQGNATDWTNTLVALRNVPEINVLVPIISAVGTATDNLSILILEAVQNFVVWMAENQNAYMVAVCGEDSTISGLASEATLQSHAGILSAGGNGDVMALVSPGSFTYPNAVSGSNSAIGGQYVAAVLAGMLGPLPIQQSLTRSQLIGINGVTDFRSEAQKNSDAAAGLLVVESKNNIIRVRHAITTAVNDVNTRELSVVRAQQYMIESLTTTIDTQVIGQVIADGQAAFTVQLLVGSTLEQLVTEGAIVTYQNLAATMSTTDPTTVIITFSYAPSYPLNYVDIQFSVNTSSGAITTSSTSTSSF